MSYNFYSLVSSIKDKSTQAMATLSSDLKEFSSIVQEDVAEVAKTVRKTVHEQSEALRQRVEEQHADEETEEETKEKEKGDEHADDAQGADDAIAEQKPVASSSLFASFAGMSLEAMGSKFLQSADELLGSLAGPNQDKDEQDGDDQDDKLESARRYRLLALQEDAHTYLHPPMDVETFHKWRKTLADEELQAIQEEVVAHYPTVVEKLAELVPESVSNEDFWAHYIYKASLLAAQEQRGADLLEHALNDSEEEVGWDVGTPHGSENEDDGEGFPSYEEDAMATESLPILEGVDPAEPSSPAPVLEESQQRPVSPTGSDIEGDSRASPIDSISSDGESWIELDEQRREQSQQPPLSSSSTSSVVPVDSAAPTPPPAPAAAPVVARLSEDHVENEEEDVDWGDDVDPEIPPPVMSSGEVKPAEDQPPKQAGRADWGEWD